MAENDPDLVSLWSKKFDIPPISQDLFGNMIIFKASTTYHLYN